LFGPGVERVYRLGYNLFAVLSLVPVLAQVGLHPGRTIYIVQLPWSVLILAGEVSALLALVIGFLQSQPSDFLGLRQLVSPGGQDRCLTTDGLYRNIRHPLYSASLLIIWLVPRMTVNLVGMNLTLTAYIIIGAIFEERKLRMEFGQEYIDYMTDTPLFVPFLKRTKGNHGASRKHCSFARSIITGNDLRHYSP